MIQSMHNKHVFFVLPGELVEGVPRWRTGLWVWFDETGTLGGHGATEKDAIAHLARYAEKLGVSKRGLEWPITVTTFKVTK